jgi:hypothetical protein
MRVLLPADLTYVGEAHGIPYDGASPLSGTTTGGGGANNGYTDPGMVFQLRPNGDGTWQGAMPYAFCMVLACGDGYRPPHIIRVGPRQQLTMWLPERHLRQEHHQKTTTKYNHAEHEHNRACQEEVMHIGRLCSGSHERVGRGNAAANAMTGELIFGKCAHYRVWVSSDDAPPTLLERLLVHSQRVDFG